MSPVDKTSNFIKTWWGPLTGLIMVVGSYYRLDGADRTNSMELKQHKELVQQQYDTAQADLKRVDLAWRTEVEKVCSAINKEIARIDHSGTENSIALANRVAAMRQDSLNLKEDVQEIKADVKDIKSILRGQ